MKQPQYSDLGFEPQLNSTRNYPDGFVTMEQVEREQKEIEIIIEENGDLR